MIVALEGLAAGAAHVLTGPDHLVGVAPLAVEEAADGPRNSDPARRVRPWLVGAIWGIGHGLGVGVLGVLGQTLLTAAQVEATSGWSERLVGVLLIGLGVHAIRRSRSLVLHEHRHAHGGTEHTHLHLHKHPHGAGEHKKGERHRHAALGVGLLHGLAGAGHLWAVLPSLAMGRAEAATYIGTYILSSILLMTAFGAVLGRVTQAMGTAWIPGFFRTIGVVTAVVGVVWLVLAF